MHTFGLKEMYDQFQLSSVYLYLPSPISFLPSVMCYAVFIYCLFLLLQPYIELANSYGTGNVDELDTVFQTNREKFESVRIISLCYHFRWSSYITWYVHAVKRPWLVRYWLVDLSPKCFCVFDELWIVLFQDNNLGLVKQAVSSLYKRNIQRLTQTYLTLSLQDIANTVKLNSPKEAEMHVLQMVTSESQDYSINQHPSLVISVFGTILDPGR